MSRRTWGHWELMLFERGLVAVHRLAGEYHAYTLGAWAEEAIVADVQRWGTQRDVDDLRELLTHCATEAA